MNQVVSIHKLKSKTMDNSLFDQSILTIPFSDLSRFRETAQSAAAAGITHVSVSYLPEKSRWEIDDESDPYLQWSIIHASIFKICVPEPLKKWVPADYASRMLGIIQERCKILKSLGVKAAFLAYEPFWWPESVYEKYPHLRGPRVDHPKRSRHARFSPDLTHPKVLELYRDGVTALLKAVPEVEMFIFSTNDSGVGVTASERLYNGANGPAYQEFRSVGSRVSTFIKACEEGASKANSQAEFYFRGIFNAHEQESLVEHLAKQDGKSKLAFFGAKPIRLDGIQGARIPCLYPLKDIGQPFALARCVGEASRRGRQALILNPEAEAYVTEWDGSGDILKIISSFLNGKQDAKTSAGIYRGILEVFQELHGEAQGKVVFEVYHHIDRAAETMALLESGGSLFELMLCNQRWLTRPLVPFPGKLNAEEKSYFRPHQFQAGSEENASNPLVAQGTQWISGRNEGLFFVKILKKSEEAVQKAIGHLQSNTLVAKKFSWLSIRLKAWVNLLRTSANFVQYYTLLNSRVGSAIYSETAALPPLHDLNLLRDKGDVSFRSELYDLMRAELDNTQTLIDLIRFSEDPPLVLGDKPSDEDPFTLSPELLKQLERKRQLILKHWLDVDQIAIRPNY